MTWPLIILLLLAMAATVYVLVREVMLMASGRDITGEQSQKLMQRRVLYQGIAIILAVLVMMAAGASR